MTRRDSVTGLLLYAGQGPLWLLGGLGAVLLVLAGCSSTSQQRAQAEDDSEVRRREIPTVGDRTSVGNAEMVPLGGVGIVTGLEGTGGDCAHDSYRSMLADTLRKQGVQNVNQVLTSPDNALVIIDALHAARRRKGRPDRRGGQAPARQQGHEPSRRRAAQVQAVQLRLRPQPPSGL